MPEFPSGIWKKDGRNPFAMQEDWAILVASAEGYCNLFHRECERLGISTDDENTPYEDIQIISPPLVFVEYRAIHISPLLRARMTISDATHCVRDRIKKIRSHLRKNLVDMGTCDPERSMAVLYGEAWIPYKEALCKAGHLPREWKAPYGPGAKGRASRGLESVLNKLSGYHTSRSGIGQKRARAESPKKDPMPDPIDSVDKDKELIQRARKFNMCRAQAPWEPLDTISADVRAIADKIWHAPVREHA